MMKKFFLMIYFGIISLGMIAQRPTMELTFTAIDSAAWIQLDSIKVMNRTQGGDTVLYWPDTVLLLNFQLGMLEPKIDDQGFHVYQNFPNPVTVQTSITLYIPNMDKVSLILTDILGRVILESERVLDKGIHSFRFTPGTANVYFFTAQWRGNSSSIKILCTSFYSAGTVSLELSGSEPSSLLFKVSEAIQGFKFSLGDELLYIGYKDNIQSGITDAPLESKTCKFQFATNIPCPGTPAVEYEEKIYNTIQIFSQCWLKENLDVGLMKTNSYWMADNGILEKYCYQNNPENCAIYGGLYQWWEAMQYSLQEGAQGICPPGWHIPSDEEWKVLEGAVDSQFGIGDPEWDTLSQTFHGFNCGTKLKSTNGWQENGNGTDLFGFSGMPGGARDYESTYNWLGTHGLWWTSTRRFDFETYDTALGRGFYSFHPAIGHIINYEFGFSVRCIRDY